MKPCQGDFTPKLNCLYTITLLRFFWVPVYGRDVGTVLANILLTYSDAARYKQKLINQKYKIKFLFFTINIYG